MKPSGTKMSNKTRRLGAHTYRFENTDLPLYQQLIRAADVSTNTNYTFQMNGC